MVLVKRITGVIKSPLGLTEQGSVWLSMVCVCVWIFSQCFRLEETSMNAYVCDAALYCTWQMTSGTFLYTNCSPLRTCAWLCSLHNQHPNENVLRLRVASPDLWGSFSSSRFWLKDNPQMLLEGLRWSGPGRSDRGEIWWGVFFFAKLGRSDSRMCALMIARP